MYSCHSEDIYHPSDHKKQGRGPVKLVMLTVVSHKYTPHDQIITKENYLEVTHCLCDA